MISMGNIG